MGSKPDKRKGNTARMKNTLNICQLPDLVLEDIALFLEPTDIVNLSEASTCFQDLRRLLPKYLPLEGEDFKKYGPGDGCFEPETYFDGPIMCQKIKSIKLNFRWKDQVRCHCNTKITHSNCPNF